MTAGLRPFFYGNMATAETVAWSVRLGVEVLQCKRR